MVFLKYHSYRKALRNKNVFAVLIFLTVAEFATAQSADTTKIEKKSFNRVGFTGALTVNKQGDNESLPLSFIGTFRHHPIPGLGLGGGVGLLDSYWQFEQMQFLPLFAVVQGEAGDANAKLVGFTHWGYNFALKKDERENEWFGRAFEGGWMWNLGAGLKFRVKDAWIQITAGYRFFKGTITETSYNEGEPTYINRQLRNFNRTELSIGIEI